MIDVKSIADNADMIINGYAFTKDGSMIKILNLNNPLCSAVIDEDSRMLETSMDDMELGIVCRYFKENKQFIEE